MQIDTFERQLTDIHPEAEIRRTTDDAVMVRMDMTKDALLLAEDCGLDTVSAIDPDTEPHVFLFEADE